MEENGLTAPMQVDYPGIEVPIERFPDPVQRKGKQLQQVDQETTYYEGDYQQKHHDLPLLQPPKTPHEKVFRPTHRRYWAAVSWGLPIYKFTEVLNT